MTHPPSKTIAVIIPTYNGASTLENCLATIQQQEVSVDEVILVDGGSTDRTVAIAKSFRVEVIETLPNRCLQRNRGAQTAGTDMLLFIDQDMCLAPTLVGECLDLWSKHGQDVAIVLRERMFGDSYCARVRGFQREFFDVWWMEAARGFSRELFLNASGYEPALAGLEDWDLDQRIRNIGVPVIRTTSTIFHDEGSPTLLQLLSKKAYAVEVKEEFSSRHPERAKQCFGVWRRTQLFFHAPERFVRHPLLGVGCLILSTGEFGVSSLGWRRNTYKVPEVRNRNDGGTSLQC